MSRIRPRLGRALCGVALAAWVTSLTAAARADSPEAALCPLSETEAASLDPALQRRIETRRARLDELEDRNRGTGASLPAAAVELGRLYLAAELLDPAATCFEELSRTAPADFRGLYLLAYTRQRQGRLDEAVALYRRALELEPTHLPARVRRGRALLDLGRAGDARADFERALDLDPTAPAAHQGLGRAAGELGDFESAVRHYQRALAIDPAATALHYPLSQAYRRLGRSEPARAHFARAGKVEARLDDPLTAPVLEAAGSLQHHLLRGAEAMARRDDLAAREAFEAALAITPGEVSASLGLAASHERLGDRASARRTLQAALSELADGPADRHQHAEILRSLGLLETAAGNDEAARGHFTASLEIQPEQPELRLRVANGLARAGRFAEAIEHYDRVASTKSRWTAVALERRAAALAHLGRPDDAIASFQQAADAAPGDAELRLRVASALDALGQPEEAAEQRAAARRLGDDAASVATFYQEGRRRAAAGELATAIDRFDHALEIDPDHLESRFARAEALGRLGRLPEAVSELDRVIADASTYLPAHRARLVALVLDERYREARASLQESLRTFPEHLGLALTQVRLLALAPDPEIADPPFAVELARRLASRLEQPPEGLREALALALAAADPESADRPKPQPTSDLRQAILEPLATPPD